MSAAQWMTVAILGATAPTMALADEESPAGSDARSMPSATPEALESLAAFRWKPPDAHRPLEVHRVHPGVFEYHGELIDYSAIRRHLRSNPALPAARLDRRAHSLEIATWTLIGLSGAGFVVAGAMYPETQGATLVLGMPVAAAPAVAALVTGLEARRARRLAADTFLHDLDQTATSRVLVVPTARVDARGATIGVVGVF